jgi:hypothetical protein
MSSKSRLARGVYATDLLWEDIWARDITFGEAPQCSLDRFLAELIVVFDKLSTASLFRAQGDELAQVNQPLAFLEERERLFDNGVGVGIIAMFNQFGDPGLDFRAESECHRASS